jgi:hypothetical protein
MGHDTYCGICFSARNARMCSFVYFSTDFLNICCEHTTAHHISVKDYVLFMFTHRAHACERACERAGMIKHWLIYRPILFKFKFSVNILQITTSSMGYLLFMFTHHAHACERERASARLVKT